MDNNRFFSVLVAGENPNDIISKYDSSKTVDRYVKYKYSDAAKLRQNALKLVDNVIKNSDKLNLNDFQKDYFKEKKKSIQSLTPFEYYQMLTDGLYYDENGDAMSDENPDGKWKTCHIGGHFALPFILKDGKESYQAKKSEINWEALHGKDRTVYEVAWDLTHGIRKPSNKDEEIIYKNMKDKKNYFQSFKSKDDYVAYNCAYWNYAFVDENGWQDIDESKGNNWITNFYDKFIQPLSDDTFLTIFECTKS